MIALTQLMLINKEHSLTIWMATKSEKLENCVKITQ